MIDPLAGFTVGITGDRRWEEQAEMLARRGASVVHGPVMRTSLLEDADLTRAATESALAGPVDVIVLTTGIGTRSWFGVAESAGIDERLRAASAGALVVARGPKARSAGIGNGLEVDWQAPGETSAEVLTHLRDVGLAGRRVVVQRDGGDPWLATEIAALGAQVVDVPIYAWRSPEDNGPAIRLLEATAAGRIHALTFTCAYGVGSAFALAPDPGGGGGGGLGGVGG
jgi:uroporphyrinogen-III synthase